MKNIKNICSVLSAVLTLSFTVAAEAGSALVELKQRGGSFEILDEGRLASIKGARLIYGMSMPSNMLGLTTHYVTWKGFGSLHDYRMYSYMGNEQDYKGYIYQHPSFAAPVKVVGDKWLADTKSQTGHWQLAKSELVEYHLQVLDEVTNAPTSAGFRESAWDRPISTFRW